VRPWSHLVVSVTSRARSRRPDQPQLLCLVIDSPDGSEQKHARRRSVHPAVQSRPGPSDYRPDTRQLTDRITLSDREVLENARRADLRAHGINDEPQMRRADEAVLSHGHYRRSPLSSAAWQSQHRGRWRSANATSLAVHARKVPRQRRASCWAGFGGTAVGWPGLRLPTTSSPTSKERPAA
jgi:hypothetical protein